MRLLIFGLIAFSAISQAGELSPTVTPSPVTQAVVHAGPLSPKTGLSNNEISFEYQVQRKTNGEFLTFSFTQPQLVREITLSALSKMKKAGVQVYGVWFLTDSGQQLSLKDLSQLTIKDSGSAKKKNLTFVSAGHQLSWSFSEVRVSEVILQVEGWSSQDISLRLNIQTLSETSLNAWEDFQVTRERNYQGKSNPFEGKDLDSNSQMNFYSLCIQNQMTWKSRVAAEELVACSLISNSFAAACVANQTTDFGRTTSVEEIKMCSKVNSKEILADIRSLNRDSEEDAYRPTVDEILAILIANQQY